MDYPYDQPTAEEQRYELAPPKEADDWRQSEWPVARLPHSAAGRWLPVAILLCVSAAASFAIVPLMSAFSQRDWGAVWVYASAGAIGAQAAVLAFFLVFAPGLFAWRLAAFAFVGFVLLGCWSAGFYVDVRRNLWPDGGYSSLIMERIQFGLLVMPLIALAVQAPLWPFRIYFGWRLVPLAEARPDRSPQIADYFVGTALVAAVFMCARLAPTEGELRDGYWIGMAVAAGIFAGISLLSVVPAMPLVLGWRRWGLGLAILVLYALAALAVILVIVATFVDDTLRDELRSPRGTWLVLGLAIMFSSYAVLLASGLLVITRALGCRAAFGRATPQDQKV